MGVGASVGVGTGTSGVPSTSGVSVGVGNPTVSGVQTTTGAVGTMPGALSSMSGAKLKQYRKRCLDVMANPGSYDRSLVELCEMIRTASR